MIASWFTDAINQRLLPRPRNTLLMATLQVRLPRKDALFMRRAATLKELSSMKDTLFDRVPSNGSGNPLNGVLFPPKNSRLEVNCVETILPGLI